MFSYYGSKSKVVDYYPLPKHGKIIEPFAGSARYSLKYFDRDILLTDIDDNIVNIWKWLQQCSPKDIINLPVFKEGECVSDFNLSKEEALFCGFLIAKGVSRPQNKTSAWTSTKQPTWIPYQLKRIAADLFKIKHWEIRLCDFREIKNECAVWFVDPPYKVGGAHYRFSNKGLDFNFISDWCRSRIGQVMVCENSAATWMPFIPLKNLTGARKKTKEVFWTNEETNYNFTQQSLFNTTLP